MPKVKSIKSGILQFDPNTGHTWFKEGDVIDTPLTHFIRTRLGRTLEIVELDPEKIEEIPLTKKDVESTNETKQIINKAIDTIKEKTEKPKPKKTRGRRKSK